MIRNYKELFTSKQRAALKQIIGERLTWAINAIELNCLHAAKFDLDTAERFAFSLWAIDFYTDREYFALSDKIFVIRQNLLKKEGL